ncbi:MAG: 50S ribosomal protein L10 [Rectinemataceae bacterium]|jgi:large subunit ribosomal protein L10
MAMRATKIQSVKTEGIADIKNKIGDAKDFIFTEYRGLTVEQISALRRQLRAKDAEFHVIKNNFARIAFGDLGYTKEIEPLFAGPTAVAFAKADSNEVAKILIDFAKEVPALKVKAGLVDKGFMGEAEIATFSRLPSRKQLIAMFMAGLKSPVQKLVYTLVALQEKKESEGGAAAAPPEAAPAAEAPAQA